MLANSVSKERVTLLFTAYLQCNVPDLSLACITPSGSGNFNFPPTAVDAAYSLQEKRMWRGPLHVHVATQINEGNYVIFYFQFSVTANA